MRSRAILLVTVLIVAALFGGVTAGSVAAATKTTVTWKVSSRRDLVAMSPQAFGLLQDVLKVNGSGVLLAGLDRFQVRRMVAAIGKEAGLSRPLTPHDLRHGAATCALEAGEPLHRVQQLLRHANPLTTQRYDHSRDRLDKSAAYGLAVAIGGQA